jgi:hypothetical protein
MTRLYKGLVVIYAYWGVVGEAIHYYKKAYVI